MTHINALKLLISGAGLIALSGCGLASLPGGYTSIEKQTVQELNSSNYTPRSADERAAILTQDLFAQAAFWSREYDLNPADLEAAINLSSTLRHLGNPQKSIEVAQTTRALYPRDVDLMAELAASYIAAGKPKDAIPLIDSGLAQRPNMARLWSLKGAALDQFEQFAEARQYYSKALSITPNDPGVIANVGLSYALEGDPKTAEIWLRRAASLPGASAGVRQNLSLVLGLQNKFDEAEKWASRDLDEKAAANNMSYIRTLRGSSTPATNIAPTGRTMVGTPQHYAPTPARAQQVRPPVNSRTPKTYGGQVSSYTPQTNIPQKRTASPFAPTAHPANRVSTPQPKLTAYGQPQSPGMRLNPSPDLSQYEGKPRTSREAALAAAKASSSYGVPNPAIRMQAPQAQQQNMTPQDVLGKISQNNMPKTAMAQRQQQQLAYRAQMQAQKRGQAQAQRPYGAPVPYPNNAAPDTGYPQPIQAQPTYNPNYGQGYGQVPPAQQERQPARQRRR